MLLCKMFCCKCAITLPAPWCLLQHATSESRDIRDSRGVLRQFWRCSRNWSPPPLPLVYIWKQIIRTMGLSDWRLASFLSPWHHHPMGATMGRGAERRSCCCCLLLACFFEDPDGQPAHPEWVMLLWRKSVNVPSLKCSSFPCLTLWSHTIFNLCITGGSCVRANNAAEDSFAPAATAIHSSAMEGCISSVQKCISQNLFFVRLNFVLTDIISISEEWEIFYLSFFFLFLPSRGGLLCVLNLYFLIAVVITSIFCGAFCFQHSENYRDWIS